MKKLAIACLGHSLQEAWHVIEEWRREYNKFRPHSALGNLPPETWWQKQPKTTENL